MLGDRFVGLFHEPLRAIGLQSAHQPTQRLGLLDVAIFNRWPGGGDAQCDQVVILGDVERGGNGGAKHLRVADVMVGREHRHGSVGVARGQMDGGQPNGWCRAASLRLDNEILRGDVAYLFRQHTGMLFTGNHQDLFRAEKRGEPFHRDLEHALVGIKAQRGLGQALAAQRPQARPRAAGHNQGIIHGLPPTVKLLLELYPARPETKMAAFST